MRNAGFRCQRNPDVTSSNPSEIVVKAAALHGAAVSVGAE
jgi:hypothetical protein